MSYYKIVKAKRLRNLPLNPSFEMTGNYAGTSGAVTVTPVNAGDTVGSIVAQARAGRKALRVQTTTSGTGLRLTTEVAANAAHMGALYVYPVTALPSVLQLGMAATAAASPTVVGTANREIDGTGWTRLYLNWNAAQANGMGYLYLMMPNAGTLDVLVDAAMFYQDTALHTYFDGDTPNCRWTGVYNASASIRPETDENGKRLVGQGEILTLDDDGQVTVTLSQGTGIGPIKYYTSEVFNRPGTIVIDRELEARALAMTLYCAAEDRTELYAIRAALGSKLQPGDEFELWFTPENNVTYSIPARYIGGMGHGEFKGEADQVIPLQLEAADPRWRELAPKTTKLNFAKTITNAYYLSRRNEGEWEAVGGGPGAAIRTIYHAPDGYTYVGTASDGSVAYVKRWTGYAWEQLGTFSGGGVEVRDIIQSVDGTKLFVVGDFTLVNGGGTFNRFAIYTFATTTWSAVGSGLSAVGDALELSADGGTLYIGFNGTTANGVTVNYLAAYNVGAGTFSALKSGTNGRVRALKRLSNGRGDLVFAGDHTEASVPSAVTSLTVTRAANGTGTFTGSYRRYIVTVMSGSGEQVINTSNLTSQWKLGSPSTGVNFAYDLAWTADPNGTKYRVYATQTAGVDPNPTASGSAPDLFLLAETTTNSYRDDGTVPLSTVLWPLSSEGYVNQAGCRSARIGLYRPDEGAFYSLGGSGFDASVRSVDEARDGSLVAGGDFALVDGIAASRVAIRRGGVWGPMGSGVAGGSVHAVKCLRDGSTLVGGAHTTAGGYSDGAKLARFIGNESAGAWVPVDIDLSSYTVYALAQDPYGDLWVGHDRSGSVGAAGVTTVSYGGTWEAGAALVLTGPMTLGVIRLEEVKAELLLRLTLQAGETLRIDPEGRAVISSARGDIFEALLLGSQIGRFKLRPGSNKVILDGRATSGASAAILTGAPVHVAGEH